MKEDNKYEESTRRHGINDRHWKQRQKMWCTSDSETDIPLSGKECWTQMSRERARTLPSREKLDSNNESTSINSSKLLLYTRDHKENIIFPLNIKLTAPPPLSPVTLEIIVPFFQMATHTKIPTKIQIMAINVFRKSKDENQMRGLFDL